MKHFILIAGTPASKLEQPKAGYPEEEQETGSRRIKGMKVDVRGMMKKRRITSGRAPSLTRRSSTDHTHDEHDHDHDHGHVSNKGHGHSSVIVNQCLIIA